MSKVHYNNCPVCASAAIDPLLAVRDHSVSGEEFVIWQCSQCTLRFTQDVPDQASIIPYYQSQDYISHSNTDKGLVNRMYKKVRNFTLEQKAKLIMSRTTKQGSLLDLGAGTGAFVHTMKSKGWSVTGLEPDDIARKNAREFYNVELNGPQLLWELPKQSFNAITLWHVLEHVHELHEYIRRLKQLLKPGGKLFIAVPNYRAAEADIYKTYWAAYDVPRHLYHFSPQSIEQLMDIHGLKVEEKKPMWFDAFYISLLSSRYKRGTKPSWLGAGFSGFRSNLKAMFDKNNCSSVIYIISA